MARVRYLSFWKLPVTKTFMGHAVMIVLGIFLVVSHVKVKSRTWKSRHYWLLLIAKDLLCVSEVSERCSSSFLRFKLLSRTVDRCWNPGCTSKLWAGYSSPLIWKGITDLSKSEGGGADTPPCSFNVYGTVEWAIASTRSVLNLMVCRFR